MKEQAVRREEQHRDELAAAAEAKRAAELAEVAVREDMAVTVERLEASTREEREALAAETRESLLRALEEMDRQQSKVLSAALARSDAALGEVARVKEVHVDDACLLLCCRMRTCFLLCFPYRTCKSNIRGRFGFESLLFIREYFFP